MTKIVLEFAHVRKKFRRGELYNSLRDLIPALGRRALRTGPGVGRTEFWALDDVSFEVAAGEAFAIIGGNGAGKSTMLKLLSRILRPTSGTIRVNGRLSALIEVGAGFHPDLTGRENVYLNGAILGMSRREIGECFDAIVAFSGLEEFIDTPVKRYSSGMYARLGFSVAAHVDSDVLLVDEVLSVGDYIFQQRCIDRMTELLRSGRTIVFVSHNLRAVTDLCGRSLLLEHGRVVETGPTAEVIRRYLERSSLARTVGDDVALVIERVEVVDRRGERIDLQSGEPVQVRVQARARRTCRDVSVVIQVTDDQRYALFDTCSERLSGPLTIEAGQVVTVTFELDLSLGEGTYFVNTYLHNYVIETPYDRWLAATTFFVRGTPLIRGPINMRPRLLPIEVASAEELGERPDVHVAGPAESVLGGPR